MRIRILLLAVLLATVGCSVADSDYVVGSVGNRTVKRIDDATNGVSCYILDNHRAMSCVVPNK